MRLFIAIDLSAEIKAENYRLANILGLKAYPQVRVVSPNNSHITLKFIGDLEEEKITALCEKIRNAIRNISIFDINLSKCSVFPSRGDINVIWVGINDNTGRLQQLVNEIETVCKDFNIRKENRPYVPHLTIARVKDRFTQSDIIRHQVQEISTAELN